MLGFTVNSNRVRSRLFGVNSLPQNNVQFLMYYIICTCILYKKHTHIIICTHTNTLEKEMATHSSILAWKIPWTEEPGGPQSMGSQRVGHNWATEHTQYRYMYTHTHTLSNGFMVIAQFWQFAQKLLRTKSVAPYL